MSKRTRLCPFRKVVEQETNGMTGKTVMRQRFQPCIGHKCMAYVFTASYLTIGGKDATGDPDCWGCARLLKGDAGDGD